MAGTKLLPTNAARPQAAPLKHQGTPADTRHCQGRQHRTQSLDCKTPHPNQPSHLLGILTGKLKAPNRDRLFYAGTHTQTAPLPFFLDESWYWSSLISHTTAPPKAVSV